MAKKIWSAGDQLDASDLNGNFLSGGTGTDGALSISSGTTTISASSAPYLEKNYSSISITGTGNLAFSTPASMGTCVAIFCTGNATVTTSSTHAIDIRAMGGGAGSAGSAVQFIDNPTGAGIAGASGGSCGGAGSGTKFQFDNTSTGNVQSQLAGLALSPLSPLSRYAPPGGGGASGGTGAAGGFTAGSPGVGGLGGGGLYIEVAGSWDFTTGAIDASGQAGGANTNNTSGGHQGGCGGGGGGGNIIVLYGTLVADSGTYTVSGGAGGTGSGTSGNAGANGVAYRAAIAHFA